MMKQFFKSCARIAIGMTSGHTVRVMAGPLKGRRLLRQHGLPNLSMLFGTYESRFATAYGKRVKDGSIIYDIGANAGYFSLLAAHLHQPGGQVVAFEPVPSIVSDLRAMLIANDLSDRVHACQLALSDTAGRIKMYTPASAETGVICSAVRHSDVDEDSVIDVDVTTLDHFIFSDRNPAPEVIKLDVEGAEASVLSGARRVLKEVRPIVLAEIHGDQPAMDVWDIVVPLGYQVHLLTETGESEISDREVWLRHFSGSKWVIQHCVLIPRTVLSAAA
ncbi:MAG: FkbM family methyltransferase [Planctomycetaceae bacterium]